MSREITKLFTDVDVQQHLCRLLVKCLAVSFQLLFKNRNLSETVYNDLKTELDRSKRHDITVIKKLFYNRYSYFDRYEKPQFGSIRHMLQEAQENHRHIVSNNTDISSKVVCDWTQKMKEIELSILSSLSYYRNYFSHNLDENNDIENANWDICILSSIIRLCEIAVVQKEHQEENKRVLLLCREKLFSKTSKLERNSNKQNQVINKENENDAFSEDKFTQQLKELETNLTNLLVDKHATTKASKKDDAQEQVFDELTKFEERLFKKIIAAVNKENQYGSDNSEINDNLTLMSENIQQLESSIINAIEKTAEKKQRLKPEEKFNDKYLSNLLDQAERIESKNSKKIAELETKIQNLPSAQGNTFAVPELDHHRPNSVEEGDPNLADTPAAHVTMISPEILRQKLEALSGKIKLKYQKETTFGARDNLLQISNINEIIRSESKTFESFISNSLIKSRIDFDSKFIRQQMNEVRPEVESLLANVLWSSPFGDD